MALSAAQITQVFEILGIPESGSGDVFASVATLFGPEYESYDMAGIAGRIRSRLLALTDTQIARVMILLDRYTIITGTSPLKAAESAGTRGTLADHAAERGNIRKILGNVIGVAAPSGGFTSEALRQSRPGCKLER